MTDAPSKAVSRGRAPLSRKNPLTVSLTSTGQWVLRSWTSARPADPETAARQDIRTNAGLITWILTRWPSQVGVVACGIIE